MNGFRWALRFLLDHVVDPRRADDTGRRLCRAFLVYLSSEPGSTGRNLAHRQILRSEEESEWRALGSFLLAAARAIEEEVSLVSQRDPSLRDDLQALTAALASARSVESPSPSLIERFWTLFMPEAVGVFGDWEERVEALRHARTIHLESLSPDPIRRPASELLWTSNALLTVPPEGIGWEQLHLPGDLRRRMETADLGEQRYWYDHPVPMGVPSEENEIVYGLRGLTQMLDYEKERGTAKPNDRLDVVLSASVTHAGLHRFVKPYIESVLGPARDVRDLEIFLFTEDDTKSLVEAFLAPAARRYQVPHADPDVLAGILGVDGPYARHYNFLKAIAAVWQIARNPSVRATFKIDLDQVFPQDRLVQTLGRSAFELLATPHWGAEGRDRDGRPVHLGMLAGALVNQPDIDLGLFTPDVGLPRPPFPADRWIFATQVPQALSTAAEMMTRYDTNELDGKHTCLSRVHVTGGTTGIRVDALRRFRPFTLSAISRAEDQAYLMSVLESPGPPFLRYAHASGLIMRHDKYGFAGNAIRAAAAGKSVGDYERMILFSRYADALPWPREETKASLDPFTGSFINRLPLTTSLTAFALRILTDDGRSNPREYLTVGVRRLGPLIDTPDETPHDYRRERAAWNGFYDLLECVEKEAKRGSREARELIHRAAGSIESTRLGTASTP